MRPAVRVGLVVLGAALAVYGAASLTGGWLGTPPWWEAREPRVALWLRRVARPFDNSEALKRAEADPTLLQNILEDRSHGVEANCDDPARGERFEGEYGITLRPARRWTSAGVVTAGLALVAFGAWPRRRVGAPS